ncbi:MAG: DUF169 domain-containing protein [Desulfosporosinus sp.]
MESRLVNALNLKTSPVAVIWADEKPSTGVQFKEGKWGCVGSMILIASKGRIAFFDRKTFGCPGGGTGLGFGNQYEKTHFPINGLLSTGDKECAAKMGGGGSMAEGERFFKTPEQAGKFVNALPITEIPAEFVVFKPLGKVSNEEKPELIIFMVNADQLSALVVMAGYNNGDNPSAVAPFGAACQSIIFGYAEREKANPKGVIGFFDIAQRKHVDKETLSFTVPYQMFKDMETNITGSFLETEPWVDLRERQ